MAEQVAAEGRGNDSEVAHVTPGEMVLPRAFQTPEVLAALVKVAAAHGVPLERFRVGDARNRVNPTTGAPEFIFDDTWHGALQLPSISNALANAGNPMLSGNPWSGLTSGFDRWASMPINIDCTGAGLAGGSIPAGTEPYRYEGPPTEEVVVQRSLLTDDPSSNNVIGGLHPSLRYDAARFIKAVKDQTGQQLHVPFGEGFRTFQEQNERYAQGRTKPGQPVTPLRGGESYHNYGLGFDVAPLGADGKTPDWKIDLAPFAPIAKELGFEWGGNFSKQDRPHFERSYGYTAEQLRQMVEPGARFPTITGQRNR